MKELEERNKDYLPRVAPPLLRLHISSEMKGSVKVILRLLQF